MSRNGHLMQVNKLGLLGGSALRESSIDETTTTVTSTSINFKENPLLQVRNSRIYKITRTSSILCGF